MADQLRIEYMALSDLITRMDEANPKDHDLGALHTSMDKFGYVETPVLNETTGKIVAGHGRIETLMQKKQARMKAPERIEVRADDWYVPVLRGVAFKTDSEARAYLIASNRLTFLGGWNELALAEMLEGLRSEEEALMHATGYTDEDLEALLHDLGRDMFPDAPEDTGAQMDNAAELQAKWQVQAGQVWEIPSSTVAGKSHRLICGDCTNADDVNRLIDGQRPILMVTDPPYGVEYDPAWREEYDSRWNYRKGEVKNDDRVDWREAYTLFTGDIAYVWHAGKYTADVAESIIACNFILRYQIIWNKQNHVFGRGDYHWKHEPCWYAVRKGATGNWQGDRTQNTVWDIANHNPVGGSQDDADTPHSTQKPIECMKRPIENNTSRGELVYDPFLGSGTTMVAAEQTGRICYGCEIEPKYCAVILDRMERMGLTPRLLNGMNT